MKRPLAKKAVSLLISSILALCIGVIFVSAEANSFYYTIEKDTVPPMLSYTVTV